MVVGTHVRVLHHIFDFVFIAQDCTHDAVQPLVVPTHDDLVKCRLAGQYSLNHFSIGKTLHACILDGGGLHARQEYRVWASSKVTTSKQHSGRSVGGLRRQQILDAWVTVPLSTGVATLPACLAVSFPFVISKLFNSAASLVLSPA